MHFAHTAILATLSSIGLAVGGSAQGTPLSLGFSKPLYQPGDQVDLTISGAPGTPGLLLFDVVGGPTPIPGLGTLDLGLSPALVIVTMPPIPATGTLTFSKTYACGAGVVGVPVFTQAVSLDISTITLEISNSDVLVVQDTTGACSPCSGEIGDLLFLDPNGNHLQDPGEPGLVGVTVTLTDGATGATQNAVTDANGGYLFKGLCGGSYTVAYEEASLPLGAEPVIVEVGDSKSDSDVSPAIVTLSGNAEKNPTIDFGFGKCLPCSGGVSGLSLRFLGPFPSQVDVTQADGMLVFSGLVSPGEVFSFFPLGGIGPISGGFGASITAMVNGLVDAKLDTTCNISVGPGSTFGSFSVYAGTSTGGGTLCPGASLGDICAGGSTPSSLVIVYTGEDCSASTHSQGPPAACSGDPAMESIAFVTVMTLGSSAGTVLFSGQVPINSGIPVDAPSLGLADLGPSLGLVASKVDPITGGPGVGLQKVIIDTSCFQSLSVGDKFGSFWVVAFTP